MRRISGMIMVGTMLGLAPCLSRAAIVVLNVALAADAPSAHSASANQSSVRPQGLRIFYDDATVDAHTHRVRLLQVQQLDHDRWFPETLDPVTMPIVDAWLDLNARPHGFHFRAAVLRDSIPVILQFDERSGRFSILQQKNLAVLVAGSYRVDSQPAANVDLVRALRAPPAYVMLNMYVTLDEVAAGEPSQRGDVDRLRVVYDANAIDPVTKHVPLINMQHFIGGAFSPPHPDPVMMPMNDAWLDLSVVPYRLHYRAAVTHGKPIVIQVDETTQRLSIHPQEHPEQTLIAGAYGFDPTPVVGPEALAAATSR
jgi:hypothetical protein